MKLSVVFPGVAPHGFPSRRCYRETGTSRVFIIQGIKALLLVARGSFSSDERKRFAQLGEVIRKKAVLLKECQFYFRVI